MKKVYLLNALTQYTFVAFLAINKKEITFVVS
jgi:hypothetical protein